MCKCDLVALRKEMARKNIIFHFVRNNPRSTNRFYHRFISIIGYDVWNYCDPNIVNTWKSAEHSFDKMYGLIKAWSHSDFSIDKFIAECVPEMSDEEKAEKAAEQEHQEKLKIIKCDAEIEKALAELDKVKLERAKVEAKMKKISE